MACLQCKIHSLLNTTGFNEISSPEPQQITLRQLLLQDGIKEPIIPLFADRADGRSLNLIVLLNGLQNCPNRLDLFISVVWFTNASETNYVVDDLAMSVPAEGIDHLD